MSRKLTVNEWLARTGIDLNAKVDSFEAHKAISEAANDLDKYCKRMQKRYSLKVLRDRLNNYE